MIFAIFTDCIVLLILALVGVATWYGISQTSSPRSPRNKTEPNKLLLVLVDGVGWDYLDKFSSEELPGFTKLRQSGVAAEALIPVFPSLSLVNYYSIMSGLYAESSGMVDNFMFDIRRKEYFYITSDNPEQFYFNTWNDGEPIWITATEQGKSSYWFWQNYDLTLPSHDRKLSNVGNFSLGLQKAVALLNDNSVDIAGVFVITVDLYSYYYGPESDQAKEALKEVDAELLGVIDAVEEAGDINLMVFSDHGMVERVGGPADARSGLINVLDYINETDWDYAIGYFYSTPNLQIWPKPENEDWVYERLRSAHPNMKVYKKEDIPERFHLKNHYRVAPLYLLTDEGYAMEWLNVSIRELPDVGYHGYDNANPNMHGIFFALGPDFKRGATIEASRFENVNLYQLMCHLTQLKPEPHNGTWSTVCDALADTDACANGPYS